MDRREMLVHEGAPDLLDRDPAPTISWDAISISCMQAERESKPFDKEVT